MKSFMAWKNGDMRMLPLAAAVCVAMVCAADGSGLDESQFTSIFNGKDLSGWIGDTNVYWVSEPGILQCGGREGITPVPDDYIMTEKSYADFVIRFDFRTWKGGDNGIGIRYPGVDDMAYSGIEMQLADTVRKTWPQHWGITFHLGRFFSMKSRKMV